MVSQARIEVLNAGTICPRVGYVKSPASRALRRPCPFSPAATIRERFDKEGKFLDAGVRRVQQPHVIFIVTKIILLATTRILPFIIHGHGERS